MAREVVRHVQNARREAGLEMEDRIVLYLHTESAALRQAIETHKAYIMSETLATECATKPLGGEAYRVEVKVDGQPLTIELRKVARP
jgi:isoleucyl-tRNA synthetase